MKNFRFVLILFSALLNYAIFAVPAKPFPINMQQPDGTLLAVSLQGDEFYSYKTTIDGYRIDRNDAGFLVYLVLDDKGNWIFSNVVAKNIEDRTSQDIEFLGKINLSKQQFTTSEQYRKVRSKIEEATVMKKAYPLKGSPKALVILVNYTDVKFCINSPNEAFGNMLNKKGYAANGGTGSAKDYFEDASRNRFSPQFDVYGPYELPNNREYYGGNNTNGNDKNSRQMIKDACSLAVANGVVMSDYDTDNDGYIDNVFVYFAGVNEAEGGPESSIWPHQWTIANTKASAPSYGSVKVWTYACTSELKDDIENFPQNMCGIGTFVHEFCHVLGLGDYYATSNTSTLVTPYFWSTMDYGSYLNDGRTPPTPSGYDRFALGWLKPIQLDTPQNIILEPLASSNTAYLIAKGKHNMNGASPSPTEFFILEDRVLTGWDRYLAQPGMLIWHITYDRIKWIGNIINNTNPQGVYLVRADSTATRTYYNTGGDPFPGNKNVMSYTVKLWNDNTFSAALSEIQRTDNNVFFKYNGGEAPYLSTDLDTIYVGLISDLSASFIIHANNTWKVSCPAPWITLQDTVGLGNKLIKVTAEPSGTPDYATVTITSNGLTKQVVVVQSGQILPTLRLQPAQQLSSNTIKLSAVVEHKSVVSECGFYVSPSQSFTENDKYPAEVKDTFNVVLSDLTPETTYYYKAYLKYTSGAIETRTQSITLTFMVKNNGEIKLMSNEIHLFPNPVSTKFIIETGDIIIDKMEILDMFGRKIFSANEHVEAFTRKETDVAYLHQGLYIVQLTTDKGIVLKKILKK